MTCVVGYMVVSRSGGLGICINLPSAAWGWGRDWSPSLGLYVMLHSRDLTPWLQQCLWNPAVSEAWPILPAQWSPSLDDGFPRCLWQGWPASILFLYPRDAGIFSKKDIKTVGEVGACWNLWDYIFKSSLMRSMALAVGLLGESWAW